MAKNFILFSYYILLCLFFFFLPVVKPAMCENNATDAVALLAFKAAVQYDPLGALNSWNETVHFCSWQGFTCGRRHRDRVVSINLKSRGLVGSLSPYVGNLSFLKSIILQNNSFRAQIPEEIGRLRRLQYVEFSNNSFGGEIPRNLTQCSNIFYLNLIDNNLTGNIIPEIESLGKLEQLGLGKNRFSGVIPPSIGNLTSLLQLALRNCGLKGRIPESFVQLQNLRIFLLSDNSLTGTIPSGLFNITSLLSFEVGSNQLRGTILPYIGFTLPNIRHLFLDENLFSGEIPVSLSSASSLVDISLSFNNFTGPILNNFERLTNLKYLFFAGNNFRGDFSFISSLTNCTSLEIVEAGMNLLNGSLPDSIANLSGQLAFLGMGYNEMHGKIPSGIEYLHNLTFLDLRNNYLSGPIPSSIGKLVKLQELHLEANRFIGDIPPSLGNLTVLIHLNLGYNNFSGGISQSFINNSNLLFLDLSHNNLNGAIPPEILSISSISIFFNLAYNKLTGSIPQEVGHLRNLGDLDLSNNRLSGSIPGTFSSCVTLERLHLEGNSFGGEIPTGLNALKGLQDLDLSRNHLSGPIPSFLAKVPLLNLNLSFNNLQGEVPTVGVFRNKSAISVDGNANLCGGISDLKLKSCPSSNSKRREFSKALKITVSVGVLGVVFFMLIVFLCVYAYRRKALGKDMTSMSLSFDGHFMRLSYGDLLKATGDFSENNLIGAGRFGSVYKGILDDGKTVVAVKVLNLTAKGASKTFVAECNALRRIRHRNLVKILSICASIDFQGVEFKVLVYEFKSNGSLDKWLHAEEELGHTEQRRNLTMIQRLNIAIDIASALKYLHFGIDSAIVHGDLKPSNILLDDDMTAHIGDFGLAKVISNLSKDFSSNESSSIAIKGTVGYIPPEYGMGDMVSTQGDVYSFGILLLEMFTNLRPTNNAFKDHFNLHNFVDSALADNMMDILDPFIVHEIEVNDGKTMDLLLMVLRIGVACSEEFSRDRMTMTDVVIELTKIKSAYVAGRMI